MGKAADFREKFGLMTQQEVCKYLHLSPATVASLEIPFTKVKSRKLFSKKCVDEAMKQKFGIVPEEEGASKK